MAVVELELKEALTGWKRTIPTIDGKQIPVSGGGPTAPGYRETFPERVPQKSDAGAEGAIEGDLMS